MRRTDRVSRRRDTFEFEALIAKEKLKMAKMRTSDLVKHYPMYNSFGKKYARDELKARHVPAKQLPYKKRRSSDGMSFF
jgi:hypothetical protein